MILLDDILRDNPVADAVVHVTALDGSKDGRIRRILDVSTVEIKAGHQDGVFHDGDTLARKLAHMVDRLFAKDPHAVSTRRDGLDDARHVRVDLKAGEYIDFAILQHLPAGRPVTCEELQLALHTAGQMIEDLYVHARELPLFVHEGMRRKVTRHSHAKHMAVRSHQGRCIHVDRFSEKTHMPTCEKEGGQDAEAEDHIKNQVESIETILSLVHGKILSEKIRSL